MTLKKEPHPSKQVLEDMNKDNRSLFCYVNVLEFLIQILFFFLSERCKLSTCLPDAIICCHCINRYRSRAGRTAVGVNDDRSISLVNSLVDTAVFQ